MGRRNNNSTLDAIKAFGLTYGLTKGAMSDSAMADIANAKPETDTGFSDAQGAELNAVANVKDAEGNPYYEVKANNQGGYTVSSSGNAGNPEQTGTISPGTRTTFLGKTVEGTMSEPDIDRARLVAMSGVRAKFGDPEAAMHLKQQARIGDLTELQIKGAQRGERTAQADEEYTNSRKELSSQFSGNKIRVDNDAALAKYEQDNSAYQDAVKKNPGNPAAAGIAPQKPSLRVMTGLDLLHDANLLMEHDMKFGKVDPAKALQYQQLVGQVKKEVGTDAFKLLHTGDIQGALDAFHAQGDIRLPEGAKIEARKATYDVAGQKIPTNELVVRLPNGNTQVINGLQGMDSLGAADKIIGNNFKGAELGLAKQRIGVESAGLGLRQNADARAQAEFDAGTPGRKLQSMVDTLRMGLADATTNEEKSAIAAKIQAIQSGIGPDKNAPSEVKLAAALVRAGVVKTEAEGLKYALHNKDASPEKIRADIYSNALKTSFNDSKKANEVANQAMKDLGYDTPAAKPAAAPTAADITATAKKYGVSEDEVKKRLGIK